jgi:hypothetical protein
MIGFIPELIGGSVATGITVAQPFLGLPGTEAGLKTCLPYETPPIDFFTRSTIKNTPV